MLRGAELDALIEKFLSDYLARNRAASILRDDLDAIGVGLTPVLDHLTIRTLSIDRRAEEFVRLGYAHSETIEYEDWFAKVYRAPGYPALFIDQGYEDARGKTSIIPGWVRTFGDRTFHHIAVRVQDIEACMAQMTIKDVPFAGTIVGEKGDSLRQIFTAPEQVNGEPFSVLELAERHQGFQGFSPPRADSLMQSTVKRP